MITIEQAKVVDLRDVVQRSPQVGISDAEARLEQFLKVSVFTWVGKVDGKVACVWGLIAPSVLSDTAYLWLLTTDLVDEHKFMFIRWSQRYIEKMLVIYPHIIGNADTRFPNNIRWLKFLGATFAEPEGFGVPFQIRAK